MNDINLNRLKILAKAYKIRLKDEDKHESLSLSSISSNSGDLNRPKLPHGHVYLDGLLSILLTVFGPALLCIPLLVLTIVNPCINYSGSLYISVVSIFSAAFVFSVLHLWVYSYNVWFCNYEIMKIHNLLTVIFYSMMGATLGFYNIFAYSGYFSSYIGSCVTGFGTLLFYFPVVFQRRHFYHCPDDGCKEIPTGPYIANFSLEDMFIAFAVLFILSWASFMIVPIFLSDGLYTYTSEQRPSSTCISI